MQWQLLSCKMPSLPDLNFKCYSMEAVYFAPFTSYEVFLVDTLSEVQRNFIQWSHVDSDSRNKESRKAHTPRQEEKRDSRSQNRSFPPYHDNTSLSSTKSSTSSSVGNRGRGSYSSRPFRGRSGRRK